MQINNTFLGNFWVPATLLGVCIVALAGVALGQSPVGFMLAETVVAISFLLRFTWNRRHYSRYRAAVIGLIVLHAAVIAILHPVGRSAGGIYMLAALVDGVIMTFFVNVVVVSE